jgi:hypothetical protein
MQIRYGSTVLVGVRSVLPVVVGSSVCTIKTLFVRLLQQNLKIAHASIERHMRAVTLSRA